MKLAIFIGVCISMLAVVCLYGCRSGLFNTEPFVDTFIDEEGNRILADTPRMWEGFVESVEPRIAKEVAGEKPIAGAKSWNEFWLRRIKNIPVNQENRQKYINYMIERRRQEGLPDLAEGQD